MGRAQGELDAIAVSRRDSMREFSRRDFLHTTVKGGLSAWALSQLRMRAEAQNRPNLVILVSDDMGWGDVGYHGADIKTPNIDQLVNEGVELDRYYSFPFCSPTRVALMTGRSPNRMGIGGPINVGRPKPPMDEHFLSQSLHDAGYQTWILGKWHLGGDSEEEAQYRPNHRGFDYAYGHMGGGIDYHKHTHWRGEHHDWYRNGKEIWEEGYATDLESSEAIQRLKQRDKDRPFFLYVPFSAGHLPLQASEELVEKYDHIEDTKRRAYSAMVDAMDQAIGRILKELDDEGLRDDTLVVFFSDNGGETRNGGADNGSYRGAKGSVYEGGTRVPAVLRWPGVLPEGKKSSQVVSAMDWFPTLAAGLSVSPGNEKPFDGRNVWGQLHGDKKNAAPEGMVIALSQTQGSVWDGPWKLVVASEEETMLFQLEDDPNEERDISASHPEVVKRLAIRLAEMTSSLPKTNRRQPVRNAADSSGAQQDSVQSPSGGGRAGN